MSLMKELVKGKVKTVYAVDDIERVMIMYHDKVTAGNGEKEDTPHDKGRISCEISTLLFKEFEKQGIKTHYIDTIGYTMLCRKVQIIPIEFVVRNIAAGSIVRQTTIKEGRRFDYPLVEYYLKDDSKNDPLLTEDRVDIMGYGEDIGPINMMCLKINSVLIDIFSRIGLDLVDFKVEFGYSSDGKILLADELSPDGMRLWKMNTRESMDKDLFRNDNGDIVDAYPQILTDLNRLVLSTNND